MQEQSRSKIQFAIQTNKKAIKSHSAKRALATNLSLRTDLLARHKAEMHNLLSLLRKHHGELLPFVKKIKLHVVDITEGTHVCAIYLLLCHVFDNWNSFFLIAEHGKHSAAANLLRMIKEAGMQMVLFVTEFSGGHRTNLDKWLAGDIIDHGTGRKKVNEHFGKNSPYPEIDREKLDAHIYQMESQASHNSYASVLESVSPFTEDFDFDGYTGFYRTNSWLHYASTSLAEINIAMKAVYLNVIKDVEDVELLNQILKKYFPDIEGAISKESIKDFIK